MADVTDIPTVARATELEAALAFTRELFELLVILSVLPAHNPQRKAVLNAACLNAANVVARLDVAAYRQGLRFALADGRGIRSIGASLTGAALQLVTLIEPGDGYVLAEPAPGGVA
ncbi:hypothetical protein EV699_114136 [Plasticicumulans lactativorans]|uniref:Uncharacterized protein n=1 Tax=Plasticicumulans lactativorans TaxID=1133106 RepID=A0A4V2SCT3_9GAMM|nr:hypothetical protein [Plasticicumulans lactativorans]TCO80490.1 hypothetical protein EV699_114136 [Plasticicumulans lactativorans]